jgi:amidase
MDSKFHGIPILVKDSVSVHGMNNTAGSYCLVGSKTKTESSLIRRLRKAGAIILGKDNMSEWGNSRSSAQTASNGWSAWGGQTYGVYHVEQDPCGSSSGSAVSMALGPAAAAVGVEVSKVRLRSRHR